MVVKSLDDLIRHLLEEIALSGDQGAHPSNIPRYIEAFYANPSYINVDAPLGDDNAITPSSFFTIDRSFLEQVWLWLIRHPECRVGPIGQGNKLTLAEVEAINSAPLHQENPGNVVASIEHDAFTSHSRHGQSQTEALGKNQTPFANQALTELTKVQNIPNVSESKPNDKQELRLYTSANRIWHAIAGHGIDFAKVPHLEFACLSIIAAHGSDGILQPNLVRISGQDKRSVPRRTQQLYLNGYIIKRPVQTGGSRTSLCILRRFVPDSNFCEAKPFATKQVVEILDQDDRTLLEKCFRDGRADLVALSHIIFDILHETKLITRDDLKRKLGVSSLRWERRTLSVILRKLEALGCVKQVRALDNTPRPTLRYFRCVKLIRELGEKESQKLFGQGYRKIIPSRIDEVEEIDTEDDETDGNQPGQPADAVLSHNDAERKNLQEVERVVPQWTGSGCITNFLYDLIHRTGTQGLSTMDLKSQGFGRFMLRPAEHQLGRLVEFWPASQPLHLRHLAILRDTALANRASHYIHFTHDNYKKMVENGDASWEAVVAMTKNFEEIKGSAAAMDAVPELDEYGFPRLQNSLFQGRENDATLSECICALDAAPIYTHRDPIVKKLPDGTYKVQYTARNRRLPKQSVDRRGEASKPVNIEHHKGRPRKVPRTGLPEGLTDKQKKTYIASQRAALRYQKSKAEKEIMSRIEYGEDPLQVRKDVFSEITAEYLEAGDEIPSILKEIASPPKPRKLSKKQPIPYMPSIAAHTQSLLVSSTLPLTDTIGQAKDPSAATHDFAQKTSIFSLPSVAAHSAPYLMSWYQSLQSVAIRTRRGRGRPPKINKRAILKILAPEATHLQPRQVKSSFLLDTSSRKRKRLLDDGSRADYLANFHYLPSVAAHTQPLLGASATSYSPPPYSPDHSVIRPTKKKLVGGGQRKNLAILKFHELKEKSYEEQSGLIERAGSGVFLGHDALRARVLGQRGRTKKCRLVIFKSDRLNENAWFLKKAATPEQKATSVEKVNSSIIQNAAVGEANSSYLPELQVNLSKAPENSASLLTLGYSLSSASISPYNLTKRSKDSPSTPQTAGKDGLFADSTCTKPSHVSSLENSGSVVDQTFTGLQSEGQTVSVVGPHILRFTAVNQVSAASPRKPTSSGSTDSVEPSVGILPTTSQKDFITIDSGSVRTASENQSSSRDQPYAMLKSSSVSNREILTAKERPDYQQECHSTYLERGSFNRSEGAITGQLEPLAPVQTSATPKAAITFSGTPKSSKLMPAANNAELSSPSDLVRADILPGNGPSMVLSSLQPPNIAFPSTEDAVVPTPVTRKIRKVTSIRHSASGGGSVGVLRRKIIMDIVQKCGGVYSSDRELVPPFVTAWIKLGKAGRPDAKTVQAAYKYLVQAGKLRQLTFSFMTPKGVMVTKTMATAIDVSPTDPRVKEIQDNMISSHPNFYFPPEAEYLEDTRGNVSYLGNYGRYRGVEDLEIEEKDQVQLQHKSVYDIRYEEQRVRSKLRLETLRVKKLEKIAMRVARIGLSGFLDSEKLGNQRYAKKGETARKVERLATIRKRPGSEAYGMIAALNDGFKFGPSSRRRIAWLDPAEDADVAALGLYTRHSLHNRPRSHSPTLEYRGPSLDEFSRYRHGNVSRRHSDTIGNPVSSSLFNLHKPGTRNEPRISWARGYSSAQEENLSVRGKRKGLSNEHSGDFERFLNDHFGGTREGGVHTSSLSSIPRQAKRRRVAKPLFTASQLRRKINALDQGRYVSTTMNPGHDFHHSTGTFSVTFSGLEVRARKPRSTQRKIVAEAAKTGFNAEVDGLLAWELTNVDFLDVDHSDWPFITHLFPHMHERASDAEYKIKPDFDVYFSRKTLSTTNRPRFATVIPRARVADRTFAKKDQRVPAGTHERGLKRKREEVKTSFKTRSLTSHPKEKPTQRQHPRVQEVREQRGMLARPQEPPLDSRPTKLRRIRGPHAGEHLSEDDERRLLVAVMVIRTLTGGMEKHIDWVLVANLFQPKYSQYYIQKRWSHVLQKFRLQVDQIQARFQTNFAKAYEDGAMPTIDFDNLEAYDWVGLVDWAMENIDTSKESLPYLPVKRLEFDCFFDLRESSSFDMGDFYEMDMTAVIQRREDVLNKASFALPAEPKRRSPIPAEAEQVAIAKSWIRANVITPQATYSPDQARAKLLSIGESNVDLALQELITSRLITQQNKGRLVPGRNYDISEYFLHRLRKKLDSSTFHQAVRYKRKLDAEFSGQDSVEYSSSAENGDMLALLNMAATERIMLKPKNPPMNKFGLTDGGYQTRRMDKTRLNFDVEIRMSPTYLAGNPLLPLPPPPCAHLDDPMAKIPLWYDVHGRAVPVMWELAVAGILTILSKRPGVAAEVVLTNVQPSLGLWEVELILEWMLRAKVVSRAGTTGFALAEWWWMCLGEGHGGGELDRRRKARRERAEDAARVVQKR